MFGDNHNEMVQYEYPVSEINASIQEDRIRVSVDDQIM